MTWKVERKPRRIDRPQPGYWAVRLSKGGVEVAACIRWERTEREPAEPDNLMERSPILTARINGEIVPLDAVWLRRGREISEAEYKFLVADRAWARAHAPTLPEAEPTQPVDLLTVKPPF